ncbi:TPA: hypothetical protein SLM84_000858 [Legionella pneumophila]|nr:hypothetical protein [Legionella pneumophila]HEI8251875.1 hypothetical protein [Legionella pneumophila]HEI8261170.1 hypothetical protein [Legionella pneumophila]HEI8376456.1 hypothetical protein [Legionella pneumophila]HEI8655639.1 hypothetical protein [Legionella pneumophila]
MALSSRLPSVPKVSCQDSKHFFAALKDSPLCHPVRPNWVASSPAVATRANRLATRIV